jgi:signal transduction histidine kinase/HAMP domain-containing protein
MRDPSKDALGGHGKVAAVPPLSQRRRHSIRTKIFIALMLVALLASLIGAYGVYSLSKTAAIVADIYDRPLMAINYARSASFVFARMENTDLRWQRATEQDRAALDTQISTLSDRFFGDIDVAAERALAENERSTVREIKDLVQQWNALRHGDHDRNNAAMTGLSDRILGRFEDLIELLADHGFSVRRQSVAAVGQYENLSLALTIATMLMALLMTLFLSRWIVRPLTLAVGIANRIAGGEMQAPIPEGGADETGILLNSMTVMQDNIREMMSREQAQKESAERRLVDGIEGSPAAIVLVDIEGRIVLANSQFARFFPEIARLLAERADFTRIDAEIVALLGTAGDDSGEQVDILLDGGEGRLPDGRWIRVTRNPTRDGGFFLLMTDISAMKVREQRYFEAKIEAESANRAKSNFLANMSHELRTPLNAIIGFSEIFNAELFGPLGHANYRSYAQDIHKSGVNLLQIVNNVLELSRSQAGKLDLDADPIDLREVLDGVARSVAEACDAAGLAFRLDMPDTPLMIQGDERRLRKLVENLTSNAIKFTALGGSVTVSTGVLNDRIEIRVTDTGIGMTPEQVHVAMAPFGQVDAKLARRYEGVGIGLPLAKALVDLHRGSIVIDSVLGQGTTVIVSLPRLVEAETKIAVAVA